MLGGVKFSTIAGYAISGLMGIVGVLVLAGTLASESLTPQLRVPFGVVFILYSVYRFVMTRTRARREENSDE